MSKRKENTKEKEKGIQTLGQNPSLRPNYPYLCPHRAAQVNHIVRARAGFLVTVSGTHVASRPRRVTNQWTCATKRHLSHLESLTWGSAASGLSPFYLRARVKQNRDVTNWWDQGAMSVFLART